MKTFVNFSNHPSNRWNDTQREAALKLADTIVDLQFPNVDPAASSDEIKSDAIKSAAEMGDADAVRQLLEAGASPDDDNVLRDAIEYGRTDIVRALIDAGAVTV